MKMFKFNGAYWYEAPPLLKRIRKWFIWIGGWEKPNSTGWHFKYSHGGFRGPTPISLFGQRITIQSFGVQIRLKSGYFCVTWDKKQGRKCYISPDATPHRAHTWYFGVPKEIKKLARKWGEPISEYQKRKAEMLKNDPLFHAMVEEELRNR